MRRFQESPRLQLTVRSPDSLNGDISVPGDKSISHRALILNAVARGRAAVNGLSDGGDVVSTMGCLRAMGVDIQPGDQPGTVTVNGTGWDLEEPREILDAGNSGTSMRLLSGILAGQSFTSVISGDDSLRSRPWAGWSSPCNKWEQPSWAGNATPWRR